MLARCIARRSSDLGLPLNSFTSGDRTVDKEIQVLAQRLAKHGLLEYRLGRSRKDDDLVVIEPQLPDYQPRMPLLRNMDTLVLSRFAYMRRRGSDMVLESPRAGALFRICNPTSRPPWPYFLHRNKSNNSVDGTILLALSFLLCWLIAKSFSRRKPLTTRACDLPRETTTLFFGTFTISFSILGARQAGTPTHLAEFIHMPGSSILFRRRARGGPERKSNWVSCGQLRAAPSLRKRCCVNVTRLAAFDDSRPIIWKRLHSFSRHCSRPVPNAKQARPRQCRPGNDLRT